MRVDVRLGFSSSFCDKFFQDAGWLLFQETLLCGTLPTSLRPRSYRLRGGANPSGYTLTVDELQVFQYSLFPAWVTSRSSFGQVWSLLRCLRDGTLQRVRTMLVRFFLILSLSLAYGKGLRHVSQYLVCSFVLGILVQIIYSTTPVCSHAWDVSCILDYAVVPFVLRARLCALWNALFYLRTLLSLQSCLCDGWWKYLCILYCHQGASRMGGKIAALALHTFYRATLSCLYKTLVS